MNFELLNFLSLLNFELLNFELFIMKKSFQDISDKTLENKYDTSKQAIVLFDGHCNLCNSSVDFIIKRDKKAFFRFASLQSEVGQYFLEKFEVNKNQNKEVKDVEKYKTVIVIYQDNIYKKSSAVFQITKRLSGFWFLLNIFQVIPAFLRDIVYDLVARNRYRFFGKKNTCRIATQEEKNRFL